LVRVSAARSEAIVLNDTSLTRIEAEILARSKSGDPSRDAKLAHQFIEQNAKTLGQFSVNARVDFDGNNVFVVFQSGPHIGVFPIAGTGSRKSRS
jgi:N-acetylglucosamine kinase-like BadF-type ATPase